MKLIEPIENLESFSSSSAPSDALETWVSTSFETMGFIKDPIFSVAGNKMAIISASEGGFIYELDLTTREYRSIGASVSYPILNISLSPDGNYVSIFNKNRVATYSYTNVFSMIDGTSVYSDFAGDNVNGLDATNYRINNALWKSDSSSLFLCVLNKVLEVDTTTWTDTAVVTLDSLEKTSGIYQSGTDYIVTSIKSSAGLSYIRRFGAGFVYMLAQTYDDQPIYETNVIKHPSNAELIITGNNTVTLRSSTNLSIIAKYGDLGASYFSGPFSMTVTATHLVLRSLSASPVWNYYLLSDYTLDKSLPALPQFGESIATDSTYAYVSQNEGFATIQDSTNTIITQVNPSVTTGDKYIFGDKIYEAILDNSDQPDLGAKLEIPSWLDSGFINKKRMFDGKLDSLTRGGFETLTINVTPGVVVSGIALFNITAASVQVTMTDPTDGLVYDSGEISMIDNSGVRDWFSFYFAPYIKKSDFVSMMLPPYADATTKIVLTGGGETTYLGEIVLGRTFSLGVAQFGTSVGILDFSEKEQDQFGNFNIIERKFSKRADYDVKIPTNTVSGVQRTLSKFRATPAVWVGDESREETIIYGYYKSFDIVLSNPALSDTSILVEGL